MIPSREQNLHIDILELVSSGASLGGDAQATLEAYLMGTRGAVHPATQSSELGATGHVETQTEEAR